jgi:cell division protease FtsH
MRRFQQQQGGVMTLGKNNDLSRATDIARSMVKEYGMSRNLGQVYFAHQKQPQFLNINQDSSGEYSEMTAHLIDKEIRQIIDEQYEKALDILSSNRTLLNQTAKELLKSETIQLIT